MGAAGFGTLAGHFADRTVVTYDPRGSERSVPRRSRQRDHARRPRRRPPPDHRGDRRRPVDLFASSGGAVNALALVAKHPEDVRTLVAHEPPLASVLPDREHALAATAAIHDTYQRSGWGAGMAHFIAVVSHRGPFTAEVAGAARPGPGDVRDAGRRRRLSHGPDARPDRAHEHRTTSPTSTRCGPPRRGIVPAAGAESDGEMASRGAHAVAERLGSDAGRSSRATTAGFLGGEYGQTGEPDAFAAKLRDVLDNG